MVLAVRTDVMMLLEVKAMDELAALIALGPEVIGKVLSFLPASKRWFLENAHDGKSCRRRLKLQSNGDNC